MLMTAEQQAILEVQAKSTLQLKRGYYTTQEEALAHVDFDQWNALITKDQAKKVKYSLLHRS